MGNRRWEVPRQAAWLKGTAAFILIRTNLVKLATTPELKKKTGRSEHFSLCDDPDQSEGNINRPYD